MEVMTGKVSEYRECQIWVLERGLEVYDDESVFI